ncbi:MAG: hypothetical protein V2B18_23615 [Pseudomonadota bacterium]
MMDRTAYSGAFPPGGKAAVQRVSRLGWLAMVAKPALCLVLPFIVACGIINPGKFKGIEKTSRDESYYMLKNILITAGSMAYPKDHFDHTIHQNVDIMFVPAGEKNHYVSKTVWYDPDRQEYRTIRQTHDIQMENKDGSERPKGGTTRVHSLAVGELFKHKPGLWTVEVYLDDTLARRLTFTVS